MNYCVIEFIGNAMQQHGHFATEQEATQAAQAVAARSAHRVTVIPLINASAYLD